MNLAQIRIDIAKVLRTLGWNGWNFQPNDLTFPAAVVKMPTSIAFNTNMGGIATIELPVQLLVNSAQAEDAQKRLDLALSTGNPESIHDALKAAEGAWRGINVTGVTNIGYTTVGNSQPLCVDVTTSILA